MRIESRSVSPGARAAFARTTVPPVSRAITTPAPVTGATSGTSLDHWAELGARVSPRALRSEEHTSELQSRLHLVCRLLLEKKKKKQHRRAPEHETELTISGD